MKKIKQQYWQEIEENKTIAPLHQQYKNHLILRSYVYV